MELRFGVGKRDSQLVSFALKSAQPSECRPEEVLLWMAPALTCELEFRCSFTRLEVECYFLK